MILGMMGKGMGMMGGGCHSFGPHKALAMVLIALGVGYFVCAKAHQMECCKKMGKFIGMLIIIVSFLMIICMAVLCVKGCLLGQCGSGKGMGKMMEMPMGNLPSGHPPIEIPAETPEK